MGDIKWNQNWSTPGLSESSEEFLFEENLRDCYLYQHITKPTRTIQEQEPSILDLVLLNEEGMIQDIEYLSPLGKSDHLVISFNLICYIQQIKRVKEIYCHEKGNYTNVREELEQINWNEELGNREKDINAQWNFIKGMIKESMEKHIAKRKIKIGDKKTNCRLDSKIRDLIKRKHRAWQRYSESNKGEESDKILTKMPGKGNCK